MSSLRLGSNDEKKITSMKEAEKNKVNVYNLEDNLNWIKEKKCVTSTMALWERWDLNPAWRKTGVKPNLKYNNWVVKES